MCEMALGRFSLEHLVIFFCIAIMWGDRLLCSDVDKGHTAANMGGEGANGRAKNRSKYARRRFRVRAGRRDRCSGYI